MGGGENLCFRIRRAHEEALQREAFRKKLKHKKREYTEKIAVERTGKGFFGEKSE